MTLVRYGLGDRILPSTEHPGMAYTQEGCLVPDWALFPCPDFNHPRSLRVLERLEHGTDDLINADPECDHYVTYQNFGGGIMCVRCNGWYCY